MGNFSLMFCAGWIGLLLPAGNPRKWTRPKEAQPADNNNSTYMYSPKIDENQIQRMYRLRESMKESGMKVTMTTMVREAIEDYLTENEKRQKKIKVQLDRYARIDIMKEMREVMHSHQLDSKGREHRVVGAIKRKHFDNPTFTPRRSRSENATGAARE